MFSEIVDQLVSTSERRIIERKETVRLFKLSSCVGGTFPNTSHFAALAVSLQYGMHFWHVFLIFFLTYTVIHSVVHPHYQLPCHERKKERMKERKNANAQVIQ